MDLKDNFRKAAKELWEVPETKGTRLAGKPLEKPAEKLGQREETPAEKAVAKRTVIAAGDRIKGDLHCAGGVDLLGEMVGNISGNGDLNLSGKLTGDAHGHNVAIHGGRVPGNIIATGHVQVDSEAVVTGNIRAKELTVYGKVRGDLDVEGMLTIASSAVIFGKINVGRLSISDGAVFQGEVTIRSAEFGKFFPTEEKR